MRCFQVFVFAAATLAMGAATQAETIEVEPEGVKTVALPYTITRRCEVSAPKGCLPVRTELGHLEIGIKDGWNVVSKARSMARRHCIDAESGTFKNKEPAKIFAATFTAHKKSSKNAYGYDQVTVSCKMPDGKRTSTVLKISVRPKSE